MHDVMIGRTVLGRYRIVRALAKGGMGVVYLARSEGASGFTKPVVVKRMASDLMVDEGMARMFVREARLMSRLRNPGVVSVIDFGEEQGDYLMIIEYVHGYHLGQWQRFMRQARGPFPADLAIHIAIKVLDALHYGHTLKGDDGATLSIVHRDVSPSNILIDVEGHVKLADFGVARSRDQTEQTEQSTIKGKMPYLAPELFRLEEPSPSSDAYAAAVVVHETIVGRNEFRAQDVATTVSRVLEHVPTRLDASRDDLPRGLADVIERALGKTPEARYENAGALAAALREVRPGTEEELQARLVATVTADFLDPRIAEVLGVTSLVEREQSWKNPPPAVAVSHERSRRSSAPPTVVERRSALGDDLGDDIEIDVDPGKGKRRLWIAGAAAALLVGGGAVGLVLLTGNDTGAREQTFVVVESAPRTADAEDPGETTENTTELEEGPPPATEPDAGTRRPPPGTTPRGTSPGSPASLSQPFNARRAEVQQCLSANIAELSGVSQIEVVFAIRTDGSVASASVTPASVAATAAGRCVVDLARSTRFPRVPQPIRFRIPVRVRTH